MSIKNVLTLAKQIQAKWTQNVVNARQGEQSQLLPYLGALTTYATVSEEMTGWVTSLTIISNKPRISQSISKALLTALNTSLSNLSLAVDHASNGVDWMCANKQFGAYYSLSIFLTRQLQLDSARETVALVDAAKERITQDLVTLQAGTSQAASLINLWPDLNEKIATIEVA